MSGRRLAVIGAGGHAKVVVATARAAGFEVVACFDDDASRAGRDVLGVPVRGQLAAARDEEAAFVIAVGSNRARKAIAGALSLRWQAVVHPAAIVHESARLGAGAVVFAGAVVQPDVAIGEHAIVNTGATVDHDCRIGAFAHVAPGANLAGEVSVGEGSFLGIGSSVIPRIRIGAWVTVGAGAAVVRDLADGVVAAGVPARPRRP